MFKSLQVSLFVLWVAILAAPFVLRAQRPAVSLRGTITDQSGALVPGAVVQLRGPGGEQRRTTDASGQVEGPSEEDKLKKELDESRYNDL